MSDLAPVMPALATTSAGSMSPAAMQPSLRDIHFMATEDAARDNWRQLAGFVGRWLVAHDYKHALSCLKLLDELKKGEMRDDQKTPAMVHELSQAVYTIAFIEGGYTIPDPEAVLCLNLIHDLGEEKALTQEKLLAHFAKDGIVIGDRERRIAAMAWCISKRSNGVKLYPDDASYFGAQLIYPETAFAKGLDRSNNMGTLIGVRTLEKQDKYTIETATYVRPMLEEALKRYPQYAQAFKTLRAIIGVQTFFSDQFTLAARKREQGIIRPLPELRKLNHLPDGLDPMQIAQVRALDFLKHAPA